MILYLRIIILFYIVVQVPFFHVPGLLQTFLDYFRLLNSYYIFSATPYTHKKWINSEVSFSVLSLHSFIWQETNSLSVDVCLHFLSVPRCGMPHSSEYEYEMTGHR